MLVMDLTSESPLSFILKVSVPGSSLLELTTMALAVKSSDSYLTADPANNCIYALAEYSA